MSNFRIIEPNCDVTALARVKLLAPDLSTIAQVDFTNPAANWLRHLCAIVEAARRLVASDDALFLAGTGQIGSDFEEIRKQQEEADHQLELAVHQLEEMVGRSKVVCLTK